MMESEEMREKVNDFMKNEVLKNYNFPKNVSSDGYYHIYVYDDSRKNGRKQMKAKTLEDLQNKVFDYEFSKLKGVSKSFKEVFEMVMAAKFEYVVDGDKLASIKNTVYRRYADYRRYFDNTDFEKMPVSDITSKDIEEIFLHNVTRYSLRNRAFYALKSILNKVFDYAFKHDLVAENPMFRADLSKFNNLAVDDVPIKERAFSDESLNEFLNYLHECEKKNPAYMPLYAVEMQILTGFRRGEVPPLMWSDITDCAVLIHRQQITVASLDGSARYSKIVGHTKTYKDRDFPLTGDLLDLLDRLKAVHDAYYPNSLYLFPADTSTGVISNDSIYEAYRKMLHELKYIRPKGVILGTHSFRRNAATHWTHASGGDLVLVSDMLGNSPKILQRNYYLGIELNAALAVADKTSFLK